MRHDCNTSFPVLTRELPPKRMAWESEYYRMSIFTGAGLLLSASPTGQKRPPPAQGTVTSKTPAPLRGQLLFLLQFSPKRMAWTRVINEEKTGKLGEV